MQEGGLAIGINYSTTVFLCDMDDTSVDFVEPLLDKYNAKYNDDIKLSDINDYQIHKFLKPGCQHVFKEFVDDNFIMSLKFMNGAIGCLNWINNNTRLYFATAGSPKTIESRHRLLKNNLPWYTSRQLIRIEDKFLLGADYLLDDCPNNFYSFNGKSILFERPWNRKVDINSVDRGYKMHRWEIDWLKHVLRD